MKEVRRKREGREECKEERSVKGVGQPWLREEGQRGIHNNVIFKRCATHVWMHRAAALEL